MKDEIKEKLEKEGKALKAMTLLGEQQYNYLIQILKEEREQTKSSLIKDELEFLEELLHHDLQENENVSDRMKKLKQRLSEMEKKC